MRCIVDGEVVLSRPLEGPLSPHIAAFAVWAREQGYALPSRYQRVLLAACFSRWLGQKAISVCRVCAEHPIQYLRSRARRLQIHRGDAAALRQFIEFLRREGVIPAEKMPSCRLSPVEREALAFKTYLRSDRALAETTIAYYVRFIRAFLTDRFGNGRATLARLCAGDVVRFVQRKAPRLHQIRQVADHGAPIISAVHALPRRHCHGFGSGGSLRGQLVDELDSPQHFGGRYTAVTGLH